MRPNALCVIITARNAAKTIADAVTSALLNPEVTEIVVVDDASSDATGDVAKTAADGDRRLKVIRLDRNIGPAAARNLAISESAAPYIAILDADDYFLPGRVAALFKHKEWDLIADNIAFVAESRPDMIGPDDVPVSRQNDPMEISVETFIRANIPSDKISRGELGFLKPIISRAYLDKHKLTYNETMRLGEDYDLYVRLLAQGARFKVISDIGYVARVRPASLSGRHDSRDLRALLDVSRQHETLPLQKQDQLALRDYLAHLKARYLLHAFLDIKREKGLLAATLFSLKPPSNFPIISRGILKDKLRAQPATEIDATAPVSRFLLPVN